MHISLNRLYDNSSQLGQLLQDNTYNYDNVGNIISIDDYGLNARNQNFEYDNINRLIYSKGGMNCQGTGIGYETDYTYSAAGRILKKNVTSQRMNTTAGVYPVDYQNNYTYPSTGNPFAISSVQDALSGSVNNFDWDDNGNLTDSRAYATHTDRRLCWTEDNRLQGYTEYSDENGDMSAWYNYNAGGDRNFKITSPSLNIRQNAVGLRYSAHLKYPTLYASALITFNKGGYTNVTEVESRASSLALPRCSNVTERKHYFEGTNRVCSKIGGGFYHVHMDSIENRVPALAGSYEDQSDEQSESVEHTFNECLNMGVEMDGIIDLYEVVSHESGRDEQEPAFFYHSDHLGSAAYLTNDAGQVTQTLNYLPYGEDWVDIQNYAETRYPRLGIYTYNGKEKDYESGFHYYGARYYWSELLTGWLSVDPMADKYPSISPYAYCAWNPVTLIDPDGRDWYRNDETGSVLWSDNNDKKIDYNGESYRNIGKSYSRYVDGMRINYGNSPDDFSIEEADPNLNIEGGQYIPKEFTTDDGSVVSVSFNKGADNSIDTKTVSALIKSVNEANNSGANISSLHISSTSNHTSNQSKSAHSHHNGSRAIDISMINNSAVNTSNPRAKSLQNAIKSTPGWLENYGPFIIEKMNNGKAIQAPWARTCCADGHTRHIHISTPK